MNSLILSAGTSGQRHGCGSSEFLLPLYIYIIYNCFVIVILHLQQPNKPNKTISVGLVVDYWTAETVININNRHESGTVTKIFDIDNLSMFDQFMIIDGLYVVPFGNFIRYPSSEGRWTKNSPFIATDAVAPDKRYAFVPGEIKDGTRKKISRLSDEFKQITEEARLTYEKSLIAEVSTHYCHTIYEFTHFKL